MAHLFNGGAYYPHMQSQGPAPPPFIQSHDCELAIRQQPLHGKVSLGKEKDRKAIDPPPIVQVKVSPQADPNASFMQSPHLFMTVELVGDPRNLSSTNFGSSITGTRASSLHRLKDDKNTYGAYFVFNDVSIKLEGRFQLIFHLWEIREFECVHLGSIVSDEFVVFVGRNYLGPKGSSELTRVFAAQGIKLRYNNAPNKRLKFDGPASDDYIPKRHKQSKRAKRRATETETVAASANETEALDARNTEMPTGVVEVAASPQDSFTSIEQAGFDYGDHQFPAHDYNSFTGEFNPRPPYDPPHPYDLPFDQ